MGQSSRRALPVILASVAAASLSVACSNASGTSGAIGTGGTTDSSIGVAVSPRGVTITNGGRSQITDIQISIRASGSAPTFQKALPLLAAGERREIALTDFKSSDNVTLNPMFIRPQEITLTAKDDSGKDVRVNVPWK